MRPIRDETFEGLFRENYAAARAYERLPLDARSREQLDLDPHPGATCAPGTGDVRGKRAPGFPNPCAGR